LAVLGVKESLTLEQAVPLHVSGANLALAIVLSVLYEI
jgi:hypothetical protein